MQGNIKSGSASGKSTFVQKIMNDPELKDRIAIMGMDNFYRGLPKGINPDDYDFDHPKSLNMDKIRDCLKELFSKNEVSYSIYDFKTHGPSG